MTGGTITSQIAVPKGLGLRFPGITQSGGSMHTLGVPATIVLAVSRILNQHAMMRMTISFLSAAVLQTGAAISG